MSVLVDTVALITMPGEFVFIRELKTGEPWFADSSGTQYKIKNYIENTKGRSQEANKQINKIK